MDRRTPALLVVVLAAALDLTDGTVVNIVLPVIQRDLGAGDGTAAMIATAYTLALGTLLITGGRLGDLLGHRRMLAVGTVGFIVASVLCATAPTAAWLVAARALQGVASAVLVPQVLAIIQRLYPAAERGPALGLFATVTGIATVSAPLLGAGVAALDLFGWGWRAIFAINVPAGLLVLLGLTLAPRDESPAPRAEFARRVDPVGTVLLTTGLLLVVAPLLWGAESGWPWWVLTCLATAVPVLGVFALHQRARARSGRSPVLDPVLFRFRSFRGALLVTGCLFAAVFGLFLTLALHLQGRLGWSPTEAALTVLPWAAAIPLASAPASSWLVPRFGRRVLTAGLLLMTVGLFALARSLTGPVPPDGPEALVPSLAVAGSGMGLVLASVLGLGLADVPADRAGAASGVFNDTQHLAGAVGVGVLGAVHAADGMGGVALAVPVLVACALPAVRLLPRAAR